LNEPRAYHTATLLPTGQVIVVGGYGTSPSLLNMEVYNPSAGSWATNNSYYGEYYHTATLLPSGFVLITDGESGSLNLEGNFSCPGNGSLFTPE
jgi:hypothetical protein